MIASSLLHLPLSLGKTFYDYLFSFWPTIFSLCHCRSVKFVSGLAITKIYVNVKVVSVLTPFFTNHFKGITLLRAAILSNVREGLSGLALLLFTYVSDAFGCHQMVVLCSSVAFTIGLVLLYLTASEVIPQDMALYSLVSAVIGVSKSGWQPILTDFFKGQLRSHDIQGREEVGKEDEGRVQGRLTAWNHIAFLLAIVLIVILLPVPGWRAKLIVSASVVAISCALFLSGISKFHQIDNIISPPVIVFRVLCAAYLNRNLPYPQSPDKFFVNEGNHRFLPPDLGVGRCIDKAAIIEQGQGRLCTAAQVKETKLLLSMVPMWVVVSVVFGMVQTTGNTFFPEQADNMHSQIGITPLLIFQGWTSGAASRLCKILLKRASDEKRRGWMVVRICLGMALYALCFLFAWYVEVHKLRVVEKKQLQLKPKDKLPVSTWMLAPQFLFSGCAQGLTLRGVVEFYRYQVPRSMESYGEVFHSFFVGIGSILSISCMVGFRRWFGQSLNSSRLDKYYMFIILLCSANFFLSSGLLIWIYLFKLIDKTAGCDLQTDSETDNVNAMEEEEMQTLYAQTATDAIGDKNSDDATTTQKLEEV